MIFFIYLSVKYPLRPIDRTYDDVKVLSARIKPKQTRVELDFELNTNNDNYSRVKGEQFAINVDGGALGFGRSSSNKQGNMFN